VIAVGRGRGGFDIDHFAAAQDGDRRTGSEDRSPPADDIAGAN
jgi:hypothetical protein